MKICLSCNQSLPESSFHKRTYASGNIGLQPKCKKCQHNRRAKYYKPIDHCHSTNKVRGVLCNNCNTALGLVGDNISTLTNAVKYLQKHQ